MTATMRPVIVQDASSGRVLMLAWAEEQALAATEQTGEAHFWSRSRNELWRKGATSGSIMKVLAVRTDCDADALLYEVEPSGPACHTGTESCFSEAGDGPAQGFARLERLWTTIARRLAERPEGSYTSWLVDGGPDRVVRKVVEEATEVALAAKDHATGAADDRRVAEEAADLLYHLLVTLAEREVPAAAVMDVLDERAG